MRLLLPLSISALRSHLPLASRVPSAYQRSFVSIPQNPAPPDMSIPDVRGQSQTEPKKLGHGVYLFDSNAERDSSSNAPDVVLVFGWMNGRMSHVQKYTDKYRALYPSARILLVQTYSNLFWSGKTAKDASVRPVIDYLDRGKITSVGNAQADQKLLVHSFSNGGAALLAHMGGMLQARQAAAGSTRPGLPAEGVIFDSAPGSSALGGMLIAFTSGIRNPFALYGTRALVVAIWSLYRLYMLAFPWRPISVDKIRSDLLDSNTLPRGAKRLYIYSKNDQIIPYKDVENNIEDARRVGIEVIAECYENSPHVSHGRTDGKRYWDAVAAFWKSCTTSKT